MKYFINPEKISSAFLVPTALVDNHLNFAKPEYIKVLLYILRHLADNPSKEEIIAACEVSEYEFKEAIFYFADAGILNLANQEPESSQAPKKVITKDLKPSRSDVLKRGREDKRLTYLLREAQLKFGRNLKTNESTTLTYLYDDLGLDVSVILLILQHAQERNRANIKFIESVAVDWVNRGITTIVEADEELRKMTLCDEAWKIVSLAFGLERRKPSKKESEFAYMWIEEWKIPQEMLTMAYEECVNKKSKFVFSYTAKIIENWHNKGYTTIEQINNEPKKEKETMAAYDLDLFEKMLNQRNREND